MITNPINMALKGVPKIEEQDMAVKKTPSKGLLTRTMDSPKPKSNSADDIRMRVARYVQDIRSKRKGLTDA